jgi:hypothetical protein
MDIRNFIIVVSAGIGACASPKAPITSVGDSAVEARARGDGDGDVGEPDSIAEEGTPTTLPFMRFEYFDPATNLGPQVPAVLVHGCCGALREADVAPLIGHISLTEWPDGAPLAVTTKTTLTDADARIDVTATKAPSAGRWYRLRVDGAASGIVQFDPSTSARLDLDGVFMRFRSDSAPQLAYMSACKKVGTVELTARFSEDVTTIGSNWLQATQGGGAVSCSNYDFLPSKQSMGDAACIWNLSLGGTVTMDGTLKLASGAIVPPISITIPAAASAPTDGACVTVRPPL